MCETKVIVEWTLTFSNVLDQANFDTINLSISEDWQSMLLGTPNLDLSKLHIFEEISLWILSRLPYLSS